MIIWCSHVLKHTLHFLSQVSACSFWCFPIHSFSCLQSPSAVIPFTLLFTIILLCYLELWLQTLSQASASRVLFWVFQQIISIILLHTSLHSSSSYPSSDYLCNSGLSQQITFTLVVVLISFCEVHPKAASTFTLVLFRLISV